MPSKKGLYKKTKIKKEKERKRKKRVKSRGKNNGFYFFKKVLAIFSSSFCSQKKKWIKKEMREREYMPHTKQKKSPKLWACIV